LMLPLEPPSRSIYDMADLYDAVVQSGPCEAFYRDLARRAAGPVLELACGTGRLAIPICAAGHEVTGLDNAPRMLARAAAKAERKGLRLSWLLGDMREFEIDQRFGLIVLSCNSLAHLTSPEDVRACLASVRRHLAPGGLFAFDVVLPDPRNLVATAPRRLDRGPNPSSAIAAEEAVVRYDPVTQIRHAEWRLRPAGSTRAARIRLSLRQFFPQELPLLLELAGFQLIERYGDFARGELRSDSLNQICVAR